MKGRPWFFGNSNSIYKVNCKRTIDFSTTFIFKKLKEPSDAKLRNEEVVIGLSKNLFLTNTNKRILVSTKRFAT